MSNTEFLLEAIAENWPALTIGSLTGVGLSYLVHFSLSKKPEPGVVYHDKVLPKDIRKFKRIEREYNVRKITSTRILTRRGSHSTHFSRSYMEVRLDNGVEISFTEGNYQRLAETFLGENSAPPIEIGSPTQDEELQKALQGKSVLLHSWGNVVMAISPYKTPQ